MRTDLKRIHQELKSTSIFVTHDQSEALSLADRIVVMNHGIIEQIGTPNEIYHESATMFIAKFIGSPPANFFTVTVKQDDKGIYLKHPSFEYRLNSKVTKTLKEKYLDQDIVLSVRPEKITINKKDALFETKAVIIEPQGSHIIISADVNGEDIKIQSDILDIKLNQKIKLGFGDIIQFFDPKTEKRII